jgi:nitrate reductase alpha subunit
MNRRDFLKLAAAGMVTATFMADRRLGFLQALPGIDNPLEYYPSRDWEKVYRDQYRYDGSFTFVCSPNCTHQCRMTAFTRNGVVMRIEQSYDVDRYADLFGNTATAHWNPRGCLS